MAFIIVAWASSVFCQINLHSIEDVIEYFEGDWKLHVRYSGWIGPDTFPQENLEFKYKFEKQSSKVIKTSLFRNDSLINHLISEVSLSSFNDRYLIEVPEYPNFNPFNESILADVFCIKNMVERDTIKLSGCIPDVPTHIVTRESMTNLKSEQLVNNLHLYPNPCRNTIKLSKELPIKSQLQIHDIGGKLIRKIEIEQPFSLI